MTHIQLTEAQARAGEMLLDALDGDVRAKSRLTEAISTSDIPVQLRPTLTRMAETAYNEVESTWTDYATRDTTPDFESHRAFTFEWDDKFIPSEKDGKEFYSGGLAPVGELGEYPSLTMSASQTDIQTRKNGVRVPISWEAIVRSGNFGLIPKAIAEMGKRAKRQENYEAARQLVDASGVNAKNFNAKNGNVLKGNPALSIDALEKAIAELAIVKNAKGVRVASPTKFNLLVPSTLKGLADAIVGIDKFTVTEGGLTYDKPNTVAGRINKVIEIPEFTVIGGDKADTAWFLLPTTDWDKPGVVNVFLEGYETPQVFVRNTHNGNPEDGDFDHDAYDTKMRHVVAGGMAHTIATLASNGTGK